ncbi:MAG: hypothetical protein EBZ48_13525 [Proteobacteria bacterium]|nr:hypothetical protein [Pseudomonadota bacterium]
MPFRQAGCLIHERCAMGRVLSDLLVLCGVDDIAKKSVVRALMLDITPACNTWRWEMFAQVKERCSSDQCSAQIAATARHAIFTCFSIVDELCDDVLVIVGSQAIKHGIGDQMKAFDGV